MIVVDTSALIAIALREPEAARCAKALAAADVIAIDAATLAETLIVAGRRGIADETKTLIARLGFEVVPTTSHSAARVAAAYERWGKGVDPAGLNFGDCFAYALANERSSPLLFVGDDFARTDVESA